VILGPRVQLPRALDFHVQGIFLDTLFPELARRRRALLIGVASLAALALAAGGLALRARAQQRASAREAAAQRLSALSRGVLGAEPQRAVLLAVEAVRATAADGRVLPLAQQALREALAACSGYGLGSHDGAVNALLFTPDGRWLASAGADGTTRLWDVAAHDATHPPIVLRGHTGPVTGLAVDGAGRLLVSAGEDGSVRVFGLGDADPGATEIALPLPPASGTKAVSHVAVSPDGRRVAASRGTSVWLWPLEGQKPALPPVELSHSQEVTALAVSPDGRWLATLACGVSIFELAATDVARTRRSLPLGDACAKAVAFGPDGRWLLTGGQDNVARLFDLSRANPPGPPIAINGYVGGVKSMAGIDLVAVLPGGERFLTGYGDGSVQLWDWRDKKRIEPGPLLRGHEERVAGVAFDARGTWLATRGAEGAVRVWVPSAVAPERSGSLLRSHTSVGALAIGPDRWLATGAVDGTVRLNRLPVAPGGEAFARAGSATEISPDSRWVATSRPSGDVWLWDLTQDDPTDAPVVLAGHKTPIHSLAISPDGRWLATASYERTSFIHDLRARDIAASATPLWPGAAVASLAWSGDSRLLIAGGKDGSVLVREPGPNAPPPLVLRHAPEGEVRVRASADGRWLVTSGQRPPVRVFDLAASPPVEAAALGKEQELLWPLLVTADSRFLVFGAEACGVRIVELTVRAPQRPARDLRVCEGESFTLDVARDGRALVAGSPDGTLRLWDLTAPDPAAHVVTLAKLEARVTRVALSSDASRLVAADAGGAVLLFDLQAKGGAASAVTLRGHESAVTTTRFSADLRYLVTGDAGGGVRLWDLRARDVNASAIALRAHAGSVVWVTTSPDSRWVVSLATDTSVYLESLGLEGLLRRAPRAAGRNLRSDEWAPLFAGQPYRPTFPELPAAARTP